jgi:hypothetical protein
MICRYQGSSASNQNDVMALDHIRLGILLAIAAIVQAQAASPGDVYGIWTPYDETKRMCAPGADYGVTMTRSELTIDYGGSVFVRRLPPAPKCAARQCDVSTGWSGPGATWTWTFRSEDVALVQGWIRDVDWPAVPDFLFKHVLKRGC